MVTPLAKLYTRLLVYWSFGVAEIEIRNKAKKDWLTSDFCEIKGRIQSRKGVEGHYAKCGLLFGPDGVNYVLFVKLNSQATRPHLKFPPKYIHFFF